MSNESPVERKLFYWLLVIVAFFGLFLRLLDYDRLPPFSDTFDEFMYPWAGISFIKHGIPTSWTGFGGYTNTVEQKYWGVNIRLATPWNEKPPLFPLLTGGISLLAGQDSFEKVRLSTIRIVPIILNFLAILFVGLLAVKLWGTRVALVSSALYATIPTIVMANRLSVTENLLIPLSLFTLWLYFRDLKNPSKYTPLFIGVGVGLSLLTKNTAIALLATILLYYIERRAWNALFVSGVISISLGAIYYVLGYLYGWTLFMGVLNEYRQAMAVGLPETIQSFFRFPVIAHKEAIFLDGGMLAGWLLLLVAPFFMKKERVNVNRPILYPYLYLLMFALLVGGQTWFGWHLFPLYPFLAIILGKALVDLWQKRDPLQFVFFALVLGASSVRFLLLLYPGHESMWPRYLSLVIFLGLITWVKPFQRLQQFVLLGLCGCYLLVNIFTVINLNRLYRVKAQPPATSYVEP